MRHWQGMGAGTVSLQPSPRQQGCTGLSTKLMDCVCSRSTILQPSLVSRAPAWKRCPAPEAQSHHAAAVSGQQSPVSRMLAGRKVMGELTFNHVYGASETATRKADSPKPKPGSAHKTSQVPAAAPADPPAPAASPPGSPAQGRAPAPEPDTSAVHVASPGRTPGSSKGPAPR